MFRSDRPDLEGVLDELVAAARREGSYEVHALITEKLGTFDQSSAAWREVYEMRSKVMRLRDGLVRSMEAK
jgi:hypothetical protein